MNPEGKRLAHLRAISVRGGLSPWQRASVFLILAGLVMAAVFAPVGSAAATVAALILLFGMTMLLKFTLSLRAGGVEPLPDQLLTDAECPSYTIVAALYKEPEVLPQLMQSLSAMDYPKERLQVLILLEEDDKETRRVAQRLAIPENLEFIIIPYEEPGPRCKPRALQYAMRRLMAGDFVVIYDAEDRPDPDQIRKAATVFAQRGPELACLQAEVRWYNREQSLMTRMAAASYASHFGLILPGLAKSKGVVPLGGTSCHIRTSALALIGGWDPYNVTEDLDLGVKLKRAGFCVAMLPSITWEEAPTTIKATVKQHSRWIKGHTATFIAHTRNPFSLYRDLGAFGFLSFLLIIGGAHVAILAAPIFWSMTLMYLLTGAHIIQQITPQPAFYLGVTCLLGNFFFAWQAMFACVITGQYRMVPWTLLLPIFWLSVLSAAGLKAAWEVISGRLYYWDKTQHGVSLKEEAKTNIIGGTAT